MSELSKEEVYNEKMLELHYELTKFCPICHMKLPINSKECQSLLCSG